MKVEKTLKVKLEKSELKILKEASNIIDAICAEYDDNDCKGCPFYNGCKSADDNIYVMLADGILQIPVMEED